MIMTDTCPVCDASIDIPDSGEWIRCKECNKGKLRQVQDDEPEPINWKAQHITQLQEDLAEADEWVAEHLPGAESLRQTFYVLLKDAKERMNND